MGGRPADPAVKKLVQSATLTRSLRPQGHPVLIHPLTDHRRLSPLRSAGRILEAAETGSSWSSPTNHRYQSALKDIKASTRQRFVAMEFDYPPREAEAKIVQEESGVDEDSADLLARLGEKVRNLKEHGLQEGVSTRLLIYAGKLISRGVAPRRACDVAISDALTDDASVQRSIREITTSIFE